MSDDLAEYGLGAWQQMIAPPMRDGKMFAAEQAAPEGAATMDRLAAFTGRSIS